MGPNRRRAQAASSTNQRAYLDASSHAGKGWSSQPVGRQPSVPEAGRGAYAGTSYLQEGGAREADSTRVSRGLLGDRLPGRLRLHLGATRPCVHCRLTTATGAVRRGATDSAVSCIGGMNRTYPNILAECRLVLNGIGLSKVVGKAFPSSSGFLKAASVIILLALVSLLASGYLNH